MDTIQEHKIIGKKRKRRAALSCNDCRRRKLKCNRELPCNTCTKGNTAWMCTYSRDNECTLVNPDEGGSPRSLEVTEASFTAALPRHLDSRIVPQELAKLEKKRYELLEERVKVLESQLATISQGMVVEPPKSDEHSDDREPARIQPTALIGLLKGNNYGTFSYGPTSPVTIVVHFPELRPFMRSIYPSSGLQRVREEMRAWEDRVQPITPNSVLSVNRLRDLLPDRTTTELLINQYMDTFETTYRILHIPSFWDDYKSFWEAPLGADSDMEALVMAILACVLCTSTHETTRHNPNGSTFRSRAITWIRACEAWLKRQSNKHRTLAALQVRCLRLLALKTTCLKTKEIYQETQEHMGFVKNMGLHRDPNILGSRCSIFNGEMRRRLWATSLELELQASIDRGLPSATSNLEHDSAVPRNLNDSELHKDMQQLPVSQPTAVFTDSSFCHILMQTAATRIKLCQMTNGIKYGPNDKEITEYEEEINKALEKLPNWPDPRSTQVKTHLDLHLRQFLIILHTPRALQVSLGNKHQALYSTLACLEAAGAVVDSHYSLMKAGNFTLCSIRSDYFRAALVICHIAYHTNDDSSKIILRVVQAMFDDTMDKALALLEERCMRPGRGSHQYWYISAARSLVQIKLAPHRAELFKRQATDRVSRLLYKTLSLQDDPSEDFLANEVILANNPNYSEARSNPYATSELPVDPITNSGLRLDAQSLGDASEWMLDNFWFLDDFPTLQ
ncbi:hypothetical protein B0J11DRAFT_106105 [Dendryphion nanum]|uniref:Zn(2)-C6 fungal-type domain-containing protein n=1 Tax=Dendryphion nanum TaxID=256645 RepID=A0A9P9DD62_9PLEO|nr:hypothetical protein B0J11DRAFT_106105 [Dendryphion nanum]